MTSKKINECALVYAKIEAEGQMDEFSEAYELAKKSLHLKKLLKHLPPKELEFSVPEQIQIEGSNFVITGEFTRISRDFLAALIKSKGGILQQTTTQKTQYIIKGGAESEFYAVGTYGRKISYALEKRLNLEIVKEEDFLRVSGLDAFAAPPPPAKSDD